MQQSSSTSPDLRTLHGANVRRLMAKLDMTLNDVVGATGLDERTVRSLLRGVTHPQARTLHKLAKGLGVSTDELFQTPYGGSLTAFDRSTNPVVMEVVDAHPEVFVNWTTTDFDELYSRVATGGELSESGTLAAAQAMNSRRDLLFQVAVILEGRDADVLRELVRVLFQRATLVE